MKRQVDRRRETQREEEQHKKPIYELLEISTSLCQGRSAGGVYEVK